MIEYISIERDKIIIKFCGKPGKEMNPTLVRAFLENKIREDQSRLLRYPINSINAKILMDNINIIKNILPTIGFMEA